MRLLLAAEEGFNPFRVSDFALVFWVLIAFVVVLYLLARRVFPRLEATLADRERAIKEDLEKAEETRLEAERLLEEYKARVAQTREEAHRVADEIREQAQAAAKDVNAKAEAEARAIVGRTQAQLEEERKRAVGELQGALAQWSAEIASRIVNRELSPETHRDLIESFIRDVGGATPREVPADEVPSG